MADVVLPDLPGEYDNPWYTPRANFDLAVKQQLEGPLSESQLDLRQRVFVQNTLPENPGPWMWWDTSDPGNLTLWIEDGL